MVRISALGVCDNVPEFHALTVCNSSTGDFQDCTARMLAADDCEASVD